MKRIGKSDSKYAHDVFAGNSHLFQHRLKMVRGEETRETLHIVLNEILKDDRVKTLMKQMVGDVSDKMTGVKQ